MSLIAVVCSSLTISVGMGQPKYQRENSRSLAGNEMLLRIENSSLRKSPILLDQTSFLIVLGKENPSVGASQC